MRRNTDITNLLKPIPEGIITREFLEYKGAKPLPEIAEGQFNGYYFLDNKDSGKRGIYAPIQFPNDCLHLERIIDISNETQY